MPTPKRHENDAARQRAYRERRRVRQQAHTANPTPARLKALRKKAETALRTLLEEMETYRDQRSETWLEGDKGEAFQEKIERIEEVIEALGEVD